MFTALSINITVYKNDLRIRKMSSAGVRFPGLTHPGIVGTAPSVELLNIWNEREKKLAESGAGSMKLCEVVHQRPLANLPTPRNCLLGKVRKNVEIPKMLCNSTAISDCSKLQHFSRIYTLLSIDDISTYIAF